MRAALCIAVCLLGSCAAQGKAHEGVRGLIEELWNVIEQEKIPPPGKKSVEEAAVKKAEPSFKEKKDSSEWTPVEKKSEWKKVVDDDKKREKEKSSTFHEAEKENIRRLEEMSHWKKQARALHDDLVKEVRAKRLPHLKDLKNMRKNLMLERRSFQRKMDALEKKARRGLEDLLKELKRKEVKKQDKTRGTDKFCITMTINGKQVVECENM